MEYSRGRMDGMALAERIVKDGGLEALTKDIQTRGRMQMNIGLSMKELDVASEHIKQVTIETLRIACVSILHDTFGFGQTRCQRFIDAFDKISSYLSNGWTTWMDLIESIKTDLSLVMEDKWLNDLEMTGKYAHPDPEDIYTEAHFGRPCSRICISQRSRSRKLCTRSETITAILSCSMKASMTRFRCTM